MRNLLLLIVLLALCGCTTESAYFFSSDLTVYLFLILGGVAIAVINKIRKEPMSKEDEEYTLGCFIVTGCIILFISCVLYTCATASLD